MSQRTDVIIPNGVSYTTYDDGKTRQPLGTSGSSDIYGGQPINISYNSATPDYGSLSNAISDFGSNFSSALSGLGFDMEAYKDLIMKNTDKNNAWSAEQASKQNAFQERQNQIAMEFNSVEAQKNRDWQEIMSNTAHQREIADLKAAGLNPVLSASGGNGAPVTSGATASGVTSSGAKGDTDTSANQAITQMMSNVISANTQMRNADVSARTNLAIAQQQQQMQYQIAQMSAGVQYAQIQANKELQYAQMQNQKQIAEWSNPYQILGQIMNLNNNTNTVEGVTSANDVNLNNIRAVSNAGNAQLLRRLTDPKVYVGNVNGHPMYRSTIQTIR